MGECKEMRVSITRHLERGVICQRRKRREEKASIYLVREMKEKTQSLVSHI